ncbi:glyoxalase/bleomycin resistance protein/dioxygenase [Actinomadura verrucosospora]|uniref:Glyoxalase/bleomycin resistance protein/dioxygenase n=1 Tax=Actinomadura verrucosospora TaxID=46165 RepID=A0A7D3ZV79_ACTVE|nr:glyoxalase/bleomycin resistance protein/dioxygenase [Actinomadura verrucosospora]
MTISARLFAVTLDCPDPLLLARFYQGFLGGRILSANDDFVCWPATATSALTSSASPTTNRRPGRTPAHRADSTSTSASPT